MQDDENASAPPGDDTARAAWAAALSSLATSYGTMRSGQAAERVRAQRRWRLAQAQAARETAVPVGRTYS